MPLIGVVIFMRIYGGRIMGELFPFVKELLNYGISTLCTVALLYGLGWYFRKLKPTLDAQNQLIQNSTLVTQALSDCLKANTLILDKVSDKLIAHDERTLSLQQHVIVFTEGIAHIKEHMATRDTVSRMHGRIDSLADKSDLALIYTRLDKADDERQKTTEQVIKIAGKVGC